MFSENQYTLTCYAFFSRRIPPAKEITLHHFRGCRAEWLRARNMSSVAQTKIANNKEAKLCLDFKQFKQHGVYRLAEEIKANVFKVMSALGIKMETSYISRFI